MARNSNSIYDKIPFSQIYILARTISLSVLASEDELGEWYLTRLFGEYNFDKWFNMPSPEHMCD